MIVPAPVEKLDETSTGFNESTGKQAVVGEAGFTRGGAVGLECFRTLLGDVHHLGHCRLHAESEFVLRDAGECFRVAHFLSLDLVKIGESIEALAAKGAAHAGRVGGIEHRVPLGAALNALVDAGKET